MAEAFARVLGADLLEAASAGIHPLGTIPPEVTEVMDEVEVTLEGQYSKALPELGPDPVDLIVDLTGSLRQSRGGVTILSRPIFDPYGGPIEGYRKSRDAAKKVVEALIEELSAEEAEGGAGDRE
jgi:arsenate reductase